MPKMILDRTLPARCPFCGGKIPHPEEVADGPWYEFAGGECYCGAVFAHDPTARNGGAALLQAMLMACDGDMDAAMGMSADEDYDEGRVERYDGLTHQVEANAFGTLYFIRRRSAGRA